MKFFGKKAIVTGANRNIGAAIAMTLAQEGADVCISYRSDKKGAENVQKEIEALLRSAKIVYADFSTEAGVTSFFHEASTFLGGVDILVNNAGGYDTSPFMALSPATFNDVLGVSVRAPMILTQLAAKDMISRNKKGAIVNISSISGLRPYPCRVAHSTAKAALNMLTQTTALELAPHGIRVNAICPGGVPYDLNDTYVDMIPLGRDGKPEDIAKTALFLASNDASWMTGHIMVVDGGQGLSF